MQQLHHKRNKKKEVEFFQNEECTIPFDFKNAKDLYIDGLNGDITPLFVLDDKFENCNVYVPYLPNAEQIEIYSLLIILNSVLHARGIKLYTLSSIGGVANRNAVIDNTAIFTIIPNLSKYIPEDNAVLFLNEENYDNNKSYIKERTLFYKEKDNSLCTSYGLTGNLALKELDNLYRKKVTIFLSHGTQFEFQKANEVAKELKEKYGVEEVNLFVLHCFDAQYINSIPEYVDIEKIKIELFQTAQKYDVNITFANFISEEFMQQTIKEYEESNAKIHFNKIITTNSTGILELQNNECLQVIDCKKIFEEYLKSI